MFFRQPIHIDKIEIRLQKFEKSKGFTDFEIIQEGDFHLIIEAKRGWVFPTYHQLKKLKMHFIKTSNQDEKMTFFKSIVNCFELGITDSTEERKMADFVIETDVDGIQTYDFDRAFECIARGEKQTTKQLTKIKKLLTI